MNDRTPMAPITQLKRTSALPGPPPRRETQTAAAPIEPVAEPQQPRVKPAPQGPARVADASNPEPRMRPISLSVPAPLLETFKRFAKRTETSQAAVLMDAITAHQDDLTDLVTTSRPAPSTDGLFVRDIPRETVALSTLSLRMRAVNIEAIDQLIQDTGADSRSHLCVAALTAYLSTNR